MRRYKILFADQRQYNLDRGEYPRAIKREPPPTVPSVPVQASFSGFVTTLPKDPADPDYLKNGSPTPAMLPNGPNWWFATGPTTCAFTANGERLVGCGQWMDVQSLPVSRQQLDPPPGQGQWEWMHGSGWIRYPEHFMVMIEESFCRGEGHTPYSRCFRGRCRDWALHHGMCTSTGTSAHPDNHQYYIDFERMEQIDIFFTLDPRRTKSVRRR